ncbi:ArsR family metal-binding transcriptional regulator [Methanolinea mesophila]|uniref:(Fe-S)-binding protein n=1 Tax=Methanolinea mesophila TaxID=547055 RepID=UPI001AEB7F98|nr:(Fe-S)-binding protein [Methanolinea mesophila]MBP1929171.1 ArsR family metal-binding transcriptional regulator [Methanolinea mesophila]
MEYSRLLTCLGDRNKFRVVARLTPPPSHLLATMDPYFDKSTYSKKMNALLVKSENTLITVYTSGIVTMTRLNSDDHGREILGDVVAMINRVREKGSDEPAPRPTRNPVDPMEINESLPHSNCGKCGFKSCFYFATMLAFEETCLEKCTPLHEDGYASNRETVSSLIGR